MEDAMNKINTHSSIDENIISTNTNNGSVAGDSVAVGPSAKRGKKRAAIWQFFLDTDDPNITSCMYCKAPIQCHPKTNGTSSMRYHNSVCKDNPNKSDLVAVAFSKEACRDALVKMVILDELPFRFVDGEGFRHFCSVVGPRFEIPSRSMIARHTWKMFQIEKSKLKTLLATHCPRICLTTDWWKSNSHRYPVLSQIARDVLAVPIFSTSGQILDPFRSSLGPKMVEALICTQNWLRSLHLLLDLPPQIDEFVDEPESDVTRGKSEQLLIEF